MSDYREYEKEVDRQKPSWMNWDRWLSSSARSQAAGEIYAAHSMAAFVAHQSKLASGHPSQAINKESSE